MGIDVSKPLGVSGVSSNINVVQNSKSLNFANTGYSDTFQNRSLDRYTSEFAINKMISSNPKIQEILKKEGIPLELNIDGLAEVLKAHSTDTKNIALAVCDNLPFSLKNKVDNKSIEDASYLHDIGKVFIPKEILNKSDKLDEAETKIMHMHSELGFELLKMTDINKKTLNLVRNHHQNAKKTGYPWVDKNFNADIELQILSTADKYSALTEERSYKMAMSPKEALTIIYQDVKEEKIHPFVFRALTNYVNSPESAKVLS
ncbi:MAG: HD domain-containing protein [Candidatus Gastranaerophilales bacterium]